MRIPRYVFLSLSLAACGDSNPTHGELTADEQQQLERAAEMLDSRAADEKPAQGNPTTLPPPYESE